MVVLVCVSVVWFLQKIQHLGHTTQERVRKKLTTLLFYICCCHTGPWCSFDTFFKGKTDGVFVEMGALDGHKFSNTIKHEKYLNWRGVLIEPDPDNYATLKKTRSGQALFHAASCNKCQKIHFARSHENAVGGIWEFMTERFKRMWFPNGNTNSVPLVCMPLDMILQTVNVNHVNFFSLDVKN